MQHERAIMVEQWGLKKLLGGGDLKAMLGVIVVLGSMLLRSKLLYYRLTPVSNIVSGSPSNPLLGGGELNAMLRIIVVLGVNAATQQTLLLSPAPHPIQC